MAQAPASFKALLRQNMDDVKKPEPLPEGTYRGVIKSFVLSESREKKTPMVEYEVILQSAEDGVDRDELEAALQGEPLSKKKLRATFYFTEESKYRFKDFCASCGIDTQGRTIEECLQETNGKSVLIDVSRTPSKDGETFYNNISKIVGEEV